VLISVNADDFVDQLSQPWQLAFQVFVMRRDDGVAHVGQRHGRIVVLSRVFHRAFRNHFLEFFKHRLSVNLPLRACFFERSATTAAVIDAVLFEHA